MNGGRQDRRVPHERAGRLFRLLQRSLRAPEIGHKRENSQRGHCVRQRLSVQLSEAGMGMETEKLHELMVDDVVVPPPTTNQHPANDVMNDDDL